MTFDLIKNVFLLFPFQEDAFADSSEKLRFKIFRFNREKIFSNYQVEIGYFTTQEQ